MQSHATNKRLPTSIPSLILRRGSLKHQVSVTISSLAVVLLFSNPRILLRIFIPESGIAELVGFIAFVVLLVSTALVRDVGRMNKYGLYIAIFMILSMLRYFYAGYNPAVVIQGFPTLVGAVAITSFGFNQTFIRHLINAFTVAMILHFVSIYVPFGFIASGLDVQTLYGMSSYLVGRSSGFTSAPGVLSLYASVGLAIGLVMLSREKRIMWALLIIASLGCGIGTGNRSFIFGLGAIALVLPVLFVKGHRSLVASGISLGILALAFGLIFFKTTYGERIRARFVGEEIREEIKVRLTGAHGFIPGIKALTVNPFWGTVKYEHRSGRALVFNGEDFVSPSNGYVAIFATRGAIFGGVFLFWTLLACVRLWRVASNADDPMQRLWASALLAGFMVGQVICLFDALLESFVMLMPLAFGLVSKRLGRPRPFESQVHGRRFSDAD